MGVLGYDDSAGAEVDVLRGISNEIYEEVRELSLTGSRHAA